MNQRSLQPPDQRPRGRLCTDLRRGWQSRLRVPLGALFLLLAHPSFVRAQSAPGAAPARIFLDYQRTAGAAGCLAPDQLAQAVEQRLGRAVFTAPGEADLQARVRAARAGSGFHIEVELLDRDRRSLGRRRLQTRARHCSALDDALALVVSLAADVAAHSAPPLAPVAPAPATLPALETPIEVPESTYAPRLGWRLRPALGVSALGGFLPRLGAGPSAELELLPPHSWPIWLRATVWQRQRLGTGPAGAEFAAQSLELGVCPWSARWPRFEARSCAEQWLGRVTARGFGFDQDQSGTGATLALGGNETLRYWLGDWFLSLSGSLLVPLLQRRYFYLEGSEITLHDQGWVWAVGTISLGLEL